MTETTKLPPMPGHPEPHTYQWTGLERRAIERYGAECRRMALDEVATTLDAWANSAARSDAPIAVFRALADAATRFRAAAAIGAEMTERAQQEGR